MYFWVFVCIMSGRAYSLEVLAGLDPSDQTDGSLLRTPASRKNDLRTDPIFMFSNYLSKAPISNFYIFANVFLS